MMFKRREITVEGQTFHSKLNSSSTLNVTKPRLCIHAEHKKFSLFRKRHKTIA